MTTTLITQTEFDQAEDRHELLRSKGIPMVRENNVWIFDPDYVVKITKLQTIGEPEIIYEYRWTHGEVFIRAVNGP